MSTTARDQPETGLFVDRAEMYRESIEGQRDDSPEFMLFSDNVREANYTVGANAERRDGLGTADAVDHDKPNEEPEIEIVYDMQRQFVDGNGDPDDPAGDAWVRDADNRIMASHHIRLRENREANDAADPDSADGCRIYVVGEGCKPDVEMDLNGDVGAPVEVTVTYVCEKVREIEIFQPPGDEALDVYSTDSGDSTQSLTIEDDDGVLEEVSLNGETPVTTTKTDWASIRGLELDAETDGDVVVETSTSGDEMARIRGGLHYSNGDAPLEGDLGVQAIDAGSLGTAVGETYVFFDGVVISRGGNELDYDMITGTLSVGNQYEPTPRHDSTRSRWNEGNRDTSVEATVIGWGASMRFGDEALGVTKADFVIELSNTKFTFGDAVPSAPGDKERGPEDTAVEYGVTFEPSDDSGVTVEQVV